MKTQIFKSYSEFLNREDKEMNGVSEEFLKKYPTSLDERNNKGCWNCSDCSDCSGCSRCSDLAPQENKMKIPTIKNIHQTVLKAVENKNNSLNMSEWHTCETTHCRAGWVVHLAGKEGKELENRTSTLFAAMQILKASSPIRVMLPRFYDGNEKAMEDIKRCAEEEAKGLPQ